MYLGSWSIYRPQKCELSPWFFCSLMSETWNLLSLSQLPALYNVSTGICYLFWALRQWLVIFHAMCGCNVYWNQLPTAQAEYGGCLGGFLADWSGCADIACTSMHKREKKIWDISQNHGLIMSVQSWLDWWELQLLFFNLDYLALLTNCPSGAILTFLSCEQQKVNSLSNKSWLASPPHEPARRSSSSANNTSRLPFVFTS